MPVSRFVLRVLLLLVGVLGSRAGAQVFDQNTSPTQVISTTGLWRFHTGDDPRWADPGFNDSSWPLLRSDERWSSREEYKDYRGVAWYRFRVVVPPGMSGPLAFQRPQLLWSFEVFANGQQIGSCGSMPPHPISETCPSGFYTIPTISSSKILTIAIRVWSGSPGGGGPIGGRVLSGDSRLGTVDALRAYRGMGHDALQRKDTMQLFMVLLQTLTGLFLLALFLIDRRQPEYFWFSVYLLFSVLDCVDFVYGDFFPTNRVVQNLSQNLLIFGSHIVVLIFFYVLLKGRRSALFYLAVLSNLFFAAYSLMAQSWLNTPLEQHLAGLHLTLSGCLLFNPVWILVLVLQRARQGSLDARLLLLPILIEEFLDFGWYFYGDLVWFFWKRIPLMIPDITILSEPFEIPLEAVADLFFMLAMVAILLNRFIRTRREEQRITAELEAARTVQQVLIPEALQVIAGLTIATAYHPAREVGGDLFQVLPLADGDTLIVLGDVSGKGLPAAMTVSFVVGAVQMISEYTSSPAEMLAGLNRKLLGRGSGFTTGLIVRISPGGAMTLANAGHLAPYLNGRELVVEPSLPLGLVADTAFLEQTFQLAAGDHLTLLTDGIPEAACRGELFGFTRTEELSGQPAAAIAEAARSFGQTDDITVLSVVFG